MAKNKEPIDYKELARIEKIIKNDLEELYKKAEGSIEKEDKFYIKSSINFHKDVLRNIRKL